MVAWSVHTHDEVGSTNDLAARLPPWHAVVARRQTAGRGRYRRSWVSDDGGLWVSAVLPTPGPREPWALLPLAAGWGLREALISLGVRGLRLRWPNDLLVGPAKLAGILVERFTPETAVVGFGVNLDNRPDGLDPALAGHVARLADLLVPCPDRDTVLATCLAWLARAQERVAADGLARLLPDLNAAWAGGRVRLTLEGRDNPLIGRLTGITDGGDLVITTDEREKVTVPSISVRLLRDEP